MLTLPAGGRTVEDKSKIRMFKEAAVVGVQAREEVSALAGQVRGPTARGRFKRVFKGQVGRTYPLVRQGLANSHLWTIPGIACFVKFYWNTFLQWQS